MPLDEEELIKTRPLLFESRPFSRLTKRCVALTKPAVPDLDFNLVREEVNADFKVFEAVITRIDLLKATNRREVERYEAEKGNILQTAEKARETLVSLRESLEHSQREKENKLIYDAIATDILSTKNLKPREEQYANLERLNKEIAELEAEREEYRTVWAARRNQFGQIVEQLERMWAQIKEDKDEQDRREGMSEEEEGEEIEVPRLSGSNTPFNNNLTPQKLIPQHPPTEAASPNVETPMPTGEEEREGEDLEIKDAPHPPPANAQKELEEGERMDVE
ncbi:hypothetical protein RUND412_009140 [Rhizina undulata]